MAVEREEKNNATADANANSLWRKPITLDLEDDDDPLANLYRGREVARHTTTAKSIAAGPQSDREKPLKSLNKNFDTAEKPKGTKKNIGQEKKSAIGQPATESPEQKEKPIEREISGSKITESELKTILKIKSENFHFTDIREILRGKSLDMYAYLRSLCGEGSVCKIKHLDLMKQLDISRPTLFKQGEWLTKLSLIEKRNVPGDHFGTSYTVRRLEEILPVSDALVKQIESYIESFGEKSD